MWLFMDFMDKHSGSCIVVLTFALVVVTSLYVVLTKKLADQTEKQASQMLFFNKVVQHRELCEKVYLLIIDWLSPLMNVHDLCESSYKVNRIVEDSWLTYKRSLPYVVYLIDAAFELRIKKICGLFIEYKKEYKQFSQTLNSVIAKIIYPFNDSMKTIRVSGEGTLHPLIGYICSKEQMKFLLEYIKTSHKVIWGYDDANGNYVDESHDSKIRPLTYDDFVSKADEINSKIEADAELNSYRDLLQKVVNESIEFIKQLEDHVSLDDRGIAKRYEIKV